MLKTQLILQLKILFCISLFLCACVGHGSGNILKSKTLNDGSLIELKYYDFGALSEGAIWVKRTLVDKKSYFLGYIEGPNSRNIIEIFENDSPKIDIKLTDTIFKLGEPAIFTFNFGDTVVPSGNFVK